MNGLDILQRIVGEDETVSSLQEQFVHAGIAVNARACLPYDEAVVAVTAPERVGPAHAAYRVVARTTAKNVVSHAALNDVIEIMPIQRHISSSIGEIYVETDFILFKDIIFRQMLMPL